MNNLEEQSCLTNQIVKEAQDAIILADREGNYSTLEHWGRAGFWLYPVRSAWKRVRAIMQWL